MKGLALFLLLLIIPFTVQAFSGPIVDYAQLVPQLMPDNADPDCQTFVTYGGEGEPQVRYYIWDSRGGRESPAYSGNAECVGGNWATGKACHSGFFNPQPLTGLVMCAIEASAGDELTGACALSARVCKSCPSGCGDGQCSDGEGSATCAQDCLFYGLEIKIIAPECYATLHRGEQAKLLVSARSGAMPLKGAQVTAVGFFGEKELFDDGKHNDSAPGDGIYGGAAEVPADAGGVRTVQFIVKNAQSVEFRQTVVRIVSSMQVNAEVQAIQKLGDVVSVTGRASSLGSLADGEARAEFYSPSGKLAYSEKSEITNGSFFFSYHGTLDDELGNWTVRVNATDRFGNSGAWLGKFQISKLAPGSFLEVEHISPVAGAYPRGSTVSVSVRVKRNGAPASSAKVEFIGPQGRPIEMKEVGGGIYSYAYTIGKDDPLGAWAITSRASLATESGEAEGGSSYRISIIPSVLKMVLLRPESSEFGVGDSVEIVASAKYPDGDPVEVASAYVSIGADRVHMEQTQAGILVAYYTVPEGSEGEMMFTVYSEDKFGNSGSAGAAFSVSGASILYTLDKNRVIVIPAGIAIIIAVATLLKNYVLSSKKDKLARRREQLLALQAKLQSQYLKEGTIDRKTFYDLGAKYDSELQRIEKGLSELEEKNKKK